MNAIAKLQAAGWRRRYAARIPLALVVMTLMSASASAAVWIQTSLNENYAAYADPSTIRRDGDLVKMWSLFNYRTPQQAGAGKQYSSVRRQFEYDCKGSRARALGASSHVAKEGKGEALAISNVTLGWNAVKPDTADDYLLKFACQRYDGTQSNTPRK
jgi:hypothetical protein